ncbi:geranylgeranyl diphosphate synthase, type II [Paraoerskovia marina]|uniref:Geranylgeranyl diphosphate synthase, type II n=1 Tax=Paraoerskovia marina TaxID=545619 RepID=A0A1H1MJ98_9CELL|nr:polyprenyl synthetase family protein [Paraoerskovia marina]SDR86806.1 geranylgeranyl diphosphate synthase, type II [Paraoerskovia marina]
MTLLQPASRAEPVDATDTTRALLLAAVDRALVTHRPSPVSPAVDEVWALLGDTARGGKHLRGSTLVEIHTALGGSHPDAAASLAAATEILHAGFLVQDDVLDHDVVRRGRPNLAARTAATARSAGAGDAAAAAWAEGAGILAGDLAISTAWAEVALLPEGACRTAVVRLLADTVRETVCGELGDLALQHGLDAESPRARTVVARAKTARYTFTWPLVAGALLADADDDVLLTLRRAADELGLAYQLTDDVAGAFGPGVPSDLREGKQTTLIGLATGHRAWAGVAELLGDPSLDTEGAARIRAALLTSGAVDATADRVRTALRESRSLGRRAGGAAVVVCRLADRVEALLEDTLATRVAPVRGAEMSG